MSDLSSDVSSSDLTGKPVREEVIASLDDGYAPVPEKGILRLLGVGGSVGATILSDVVPAAVAMLPRALLERLQIVQQAGEEDLDEVRGKYAKLGVAAEDRKSTRLHSSH